MNAYMNDLWYRFQNHSRNRLFGTHANRFRGNNHQSDNHTRALSPVRHCSFVLFFSFFFFFEFLNFIYFLYSRFLLVIHFIHISVHMSIPISQFITPPPQFFKFYIRILNKCYSSSIILLVRSILTRNVWDKTY